MQSKIRVQTRSSKRDIVGIQKDGIVKVKLRSAPVDNEANEELIALFAKELETSKAAIVLIRGQKSKDKVLEIEDKCLINFKPI